MSRKALTRTRGLAALLAATIVTTTLTTTMTAGNAAAAPQPDQGAPEPSAALAVAPDKRTEILGQGWASSTDRAVLTSGDASGFHVLTADAATGYRWRTVATLAVPGLDVDQWVGNACVTGSGRRAVVVYAPRAFTNKQQPSERGGLTAMVDLITGAVTRLPVRGSLAYFSPSCGAGEDAIITQEGVEDLGRTRLVTVDAATSTIRSKIETAGQLTSPVPTPTGIVGAIGGAVVAVDALGAKRTLAATSGVPFRLAADTGGGVVFMERVGADRTAVRRLSSASVSTLATGDLTAVDVVSGGGGRVFVTGVKQQLAAQVPAGVTMADVPVGTTMSTQGRIAITSVRPAAPDTTGRQPLTIDARVPATGRTASFAITPTSEVDTGRPVGAGAHGVAAGDPHDPSDSVNRVCAVPRNDLRNLATQPKPRQVEWAVDQAVRDSLTVQRPSNWKNLGLPAYTPQGLFPPLALIGGGNVPAQVMLGVTATESNMWQAARFALPGVTSNPLIGNYYGIDYYDGEESNDWTIDWGEADCGYGVTQVTDHMRRSDPTWDYSRQRAVALDFAVNVAAGLQILQTKWNQVRAAGMVLNNGDPAKLENWFYALWAYNSGFHLDAHNGTPWGLGWVNNPVNPRWRANRAPFLELTYADAARPQDWPYPEKVLGFAGHPVEIPESPDHLVAGFRPAWWNGDGSVGVNNRMRVKPPVSQFCDSSNECDPGRAGGPCARADFMCWYHRSSTWKSDCAYSCGNELLRFNPGYAYQDDGTAYPPVCERDGLPGNALIIDDTPDWAPPSRPGCGRGWTNRGAFQLTYRTDTAGEYPGKIDTHQLGVGFGGHIWFSHTRGDPSTNPLVFTGTWTLDQPLGSWARVLVHLPDSGAWTQQAKYTIDLGNGKTQDRYLSQGRWSNAWVSLGVYPFAGTPKVTLSSGTLDGRGADDVAWDAVAFQPLPGKPKHIVAALGDSYTSGEGAGDYLRESDHNHGKPEWNACRRSANSWPRKMRMPNESGTMGSLSDSWDPNHELAVVACSGAKTNHVRSVGQQWWWTDPDDFSDGDGQFHERGQIESGALTEWTTLVVLTIGGNNDDAFADAMEECAFPHDCGPDATFVPRYKAKANAARQSIKDTLAEISRGAPNAQIVFLGYPEVLSRTTPCASFNRLEESNLNELVHHLNDIQAAVVNELHVAGTKVAYANPIDDFEHHSGCDLEEWINTVRWGPNGDGDFHRGDPTSPFCLWDVLGGNCISRESMHPNRAGTSGLAAVIEESLRDIHYG